MRKTLLATTALAAAGAFAAGPVLAADMADKLTVGVGGYMQQWIGVSSLDGPDGDGKTADGGVSQYHDSEIFFRGSLEADNGLTFSVKVELEANTHADVIDESQATVSGSFGQVVIGSEDDPATIMHYGNKDVGVGLNCGDAGFINGLLSCARSGGVGLGTAGHLIGGDSQKVAYYTPRMEGVQFGVSYSPESLEDGEVGSPIHNDHEAVSLGLNYMGGIGDVTLALSAGYYDKSQTMDAVALMSGAENAGGKQANNEGVYKYLTVEDYSTHKEAIADADEAIAMESVAAGLSGLVTAGSSAALSIANAQDIMASQADSQTFANFGLQVGFGAFGFDVAYAVHDGGAYKVMESPVVVTESGHRFDLDGNSATTADNQTLETAAVNDPNNDRARTILVKDTAKDYEVVSAGVTYTDGPMGVSLSHMMAEADSGDEASATMLSFSYTLARTFGANYLT
ncbi:MAG: porin [Alphaproteobacteria bacterium]|nr:porin [Alphaproteobacteria bacterium]